MSENIALNERKAILQTEKHQEIDDEDKIEEREEWGNKLDFLLSCIGYAVGFGNVWRFPNLCYENGGGAFLIPYIIFLIICGMPLFFMELSLSQYIGLGPIGCWKTVSPILQGVGYGMLVISFLVCVYYNTIIAWVFYYLFESFRSDVPWRDCNNKWNNPDVCYTGPPSGNGIINGTVFNATTNVTTYALSCARHFVEANMTANSTAFNCLYVKPKIRVLPAEEFLNNYILNQSDTIDDAGKVKWELALCLLFAWIFVYFCIWKGVASVGKVVYVTATFPYVVMFILMVRGATLPGSLKGVEYYLKPDFKKLADPQVWVRAASQIFYSLGVGFGSLIAMGSYNKFNNNCYKDAVMVSLINCGTSIFCGFVVFSVLGHLSQELGLPIDEVAKSGPGLVFVIYPSGIQRMPVSTLWSILFFLMLLTLGLDSQFAMMECVITGLADDYPKYLRKYKEVFIAIMCCIAFLLGIPTVTAAGPYVVELFNTQAGGLSLLFIAFFEVVAVGWIYGADRLLDNVETMIGYRPSSWWKYCWKYISPLLITATFLFGLFKWKGVQFGDNYKYPAWAEGLGWIMASLSMVCVPIGAAVVVFRSRRSNSSFSPNEGVEGWGALFKPDEERLRKIESTRGLMTEKPDTVVA